MPELQTVSSTVPMRYDRRVHFSNSTQQLNLSDPLDTLEGSDNIAVDDNDDDDDDVGIISLSNPDVSQRHLAHIGPLPLAEASLHDTQQEPCFRSNGQPRTEIRLYRPKSHSTINELPSLALLNNIDEDNVGDHSPTSPGRSPKRLRFGKKLIRFASTPNMSGNAGECQTDANLNDDITFSKSQSISTIPTISIESLANTKKIVSNFINRFRKKRFTTPRNGAKALHVELFEFKSTIEDASTEHADERDIQTIEDNVNGNPENNSNNSPMLHYETNGLGIDEASVSPCNINGHISTSTSSSYHGVRLIHNLANQMPSTNAGSKPFVSIIKDATNVQPLKDDEVIVTDILSSKMVLFDSTGNPKVSFTMDEASEPWAACLTSDGRLAVTLRRQRCVSLWSISGAPLSEFGHEVLTAPTGIQIDSLDRYVVTDEKSNSVFIFNRHGEFLCNLIQPQHNQILRHASQPSQIPDQPHFNKPRYVCITNDGYYVISDSANHCIKIFDMNGNLYKSFGSFGQKDGSFRFPYGVACDSNGVIYVADHFNHRISVFTIDGDFRFHALTSKQHGITRPKGLAIYNSHLYVSYGDLRADKIAVFNIASRKMSYN